MPSVKGTPQAQIQEKINAREAAESLRLLGTQSDLLSDKRDYKPVDSDDESKMVEAADPSGANPMKGIEKDFKETGETEAFTRETAKLGGTFNDDINAATFDPSFSDEKQTQELAIQEQQSARLSSQRVFDPETNQWKDNIDKEGNLITEFTLDTTNEDVMKERIESINQERNDRLTKLGAPKMPAKLLNTDGFGAVIDNGRKLKTKLTKTFQPMYNETDNPLSNEIKAALKNYNLVNQDMQFNDKTANALALSAFEIIKELKEKENRKETQREVELGLVNRDGSPSINEVTGKQQTTKGFGPEKTYVGEELVDPDNVRFNLAARIIDKINIDPNETRAGNVTLKTGYGGASRDLNNSPELKAALNTLFYQALQEHDVFAKIDTSTGGDYTVVSHEWEQLYEKFGRELLDAVYPEQRIDVSSVPTIAGKGYMGLSRSNIKSKNVSLKSLMDDNTAKEDAVKSILGSVPLRVIKERFNFIKLLVNSELMEVDVGDGVKRIMLKPQNAQQNREFTEDGARYSEQYVYSTSEFADILGIDQVRWQKVYDHARKTRSDKESQMQANSVIRQTMKKLIQMVKDGDQRLDNVFYNKYMHASSVGRFFIRNTILNGQESKLVRGFVGSAQRTRLNVSTDTKSNKFKNWKYIIGKNLLKQNSKGDKITPSNMGWNPLLKEMDNIFSNPNNEIYKSWVMKGNKIKELMGVLENSDNKEQAFATVNTTKIKEILGESIVDDLEDAGSGDWSYVFQSYIDMANFDAARKSKTNNVFEPQSQTQHDGKQNGIAIQSMQTGKETALQHIGAIYSDEENVIPFGDIRSRFGEKLVSTVQSTFKSDDDKQAFWARVIDDINNSPNRSSILKDLSKTPLMEVSYGKSNMFNQETAIKFLKKYDLGNVRKQFQTASPTGITTLFDKPTVIPEGNFYIDKMTSPYRTGRDAGPEMLRDLNRLIGENINNTINVSHQKDMKAAGFFWSMLGVTPSMEGPLGTKIFMGGSEHQTIKDPLTGEEAVIRLTARDPKTGENKVIEVPLKEVMATGSAQSDQKLVMDTEGKKWELTDPSRYGQEVANQLPVLTIQQIDAAIMAETILAVQRKNGVGKQPLFMIPIHDAIITDLNSVDVYHKEINKQFVDVNKRYSVFRSVKNGLKDDLDTVSRTLNPNEKYEVSYDSKYRALHDYLMRINDPGEKRTVFDELHGTIEIERSVSEKKKRLLELAKSMGWAPVTVTSSSISGQDLVRLFNEIQKIEGIFAGLNNRIDRSEQAKADSYELIHRDPVTGEYIVYQYN